jgi:hypothetical protein
VEHYPSGQKGAQNIESLGDGRDGGAELLIVSLLHPVHCSLSLSLFLP